MHHMYKKLQNYYISSSLPISQKLQIKLVQFMNVGPKGLFSTPFSISLVFSPEPNKRKFYFPPYFPLLLFHPPCFHPNQTYLKGEDICVIYYPPHLFSLVFLLNWKDKKMWARRDYFPPYFRSLLFSLLNQIRENSIFHPIFLSFFSILPIFIPTQHTLNKYEIEE